MNIIEYTNECTIVASQINNQNFLFKNRDKTFHGKYKIIHEIYDGVEIAYATDDTEWVEGMNEYGIGFIFAFLKNGEKYDSIEKSTIKTFNFLDKEYQNDFYDKKIKNFKNFLTCKTVEDVIKLIEKAKWNGNYFVGNSEKIFSVEVYEKTVITKQLHFNNEHKYYIRTNYGIDTIGGYAIHSKYNIDGTSAYLRKYGAENSLNGFKNYIDVIKRMSFQEYDEKSPLNLFKTTNEDMTIAQYFMDLVNKIFIYVVSKKNGNFFGIDDKIPKGHLKKIKILIKKQEEYSKEENGWDIFKSKLS